MQIIEKWKNRETKKKLREENIRLKAEIEAHMKTTYPTCTVERNIQKIYETRIYNENELCTPVDIIKRELCRKLIESIEPFIEYDFRNNEYGNTVYTAILYVATGDRRK